MMDSYSLLDEPWLPVQLRGAKVERLGLLDVFRRASEIVSLADTTPPNLVAQYRLLLAIFHRALVRARGQWKESERASWYVNGLPIDAVVGYLEAWRQRFDLFDSEHPFLQVAALASAEETRDKRKPWTQVSLASANGNAPVVFDHAVDTAPISIAPSEAICHLLGFLQFTPGGLVKALRDADKAGALVNTAAVVPIGDSLAQTLCVALHAAPATSAPAEDLPAWERAPLTVAELRAEPLLATGPNDRYTRQSRAVLFERESDGCIRWLRFAAGRALGDDPQAPDPMACYRTGSLGAVRVGFIEGRAIWRDLPALLPAPEDGFRAAAVVERATILRRSMPASSASSALLVAGVASDQAKILRWRMEQILLPQSLLTEPGRARELRLHVALAENVHRELQRLAINLIAATLPDPASKDTRARARESLDAGPLSLSYFGAAQREMPRLMEQVASDQPEQAIASWERALRNAALEAWQRLLATRGSSTRILRSDARLRPQLQSMLRRALPSTTSVPQET